MKTLAACLSMALCMGGCVAEVPTASDMAEDAAAQGNDEPRTTEPVGILTSSSCTVDGSGSCTTGIVAANSSGHFIDISIDNLQHLTRCPFRVRDTANGIVIIGIAEANSVFFGVFLSYLVNISSRSAAAVFRRGASSITSDPRIDGAG